MPAAPAPYCSGGGAVVGKNYMDTLTRQERIEHYKVMANFWRARGTGRVARQTAAQYEGRLRRLREEGDYGNQSQITGVESTK